MRVSADIGMGGRYAKYIALFVREVWGNVLRVEFFKSPYELVAVVDIALIVNMAQVRFHGGFRYEELFANVAHGTPCDPEFQHLAFSLG